MTKQLQTNTYTALQNVASDGLIKRDFVWVVAKNRSTGASESVGLWNGMDAKEVSVVNPVNGETVTREYQASGSLLSIPTIPCSLDDEVRTVKVKISHLTAPVLNAIRLYDAQMATIQIHRGIIDKASGNLVDPAMCRFSGFINEAPIDIPAAGQEGSIELSCVSSARFMTNSSWSLFSVEYLKNRYHASGVTDLFGKFLDVAGAWRIWWGGEIKTIGSTDKKSKEKYL